LPSSFTPGWLPGLPTRAVFRPPVQTWPQSRPATTQHSNLSSFMPAFDVGFIKIAPKQHFFSPKTCTIQKKVVPLHPHCFIGLDMGVFTPFPRRNGHF